MQMPAVHLLWIIPLAGSCGAFFMALISSGHEPEPGEGMLSPSEHPHQPPRAEGKEVTVNDKTADHP